MTSYCPLRAAFGAGVTVADRAKCHLAQRRPSGCRRAKRIFALPRTPQLDAHPRLRGGRLSRHRRSTPYRLAGRWWPTCGGGWRCQAMYVLRRRSGPHSRHVIPAKGSRACESHQASSLFGCALTWLGLCLGAPSRIQPSLDCAHAPKAHERAPANSLLTLLAWRRRAEHRARPISIRALFVVLLLYGRLLIVVGCQVCLLCRATDDAEIAPTARLVEQRVCGAFRPEPRFF